METKLKSIDPTPGTIKALKQKVSLDTPVMMLNLLKFKDQASYPADFKGESCTGAEAYQRYSELSFPKIKQVGGKMFWQASVLGAIIAPDYEDWDQAFLVQWPSWATFIDVIMSDEYQAGTIHRTAALQDSRLIMLDNSN